MGSSSGSGNRFVGVTRQRVGAMLGVAVVSAAAVAGCGATSDQAPSLSIPSTVNCTGAPGGTTTSQVAENMTLSRFDQSGIDLSVSFVDTVPRPTSGWFNGREQLSVLLVLSDPARVSPTVNVSIGPSSQVEGSYSAYVEQGDRVVAEELDVDQNANVISIDLPATVTNVLELPNDLVFSGSSMVSSMYFEGPYPRFRDVLAQECSAGTRSVTTGSPRQPVSPLSGRTTTSAQAQEPSSECGVAAEQEAIAGGLAKLGPEPITGRSWSDVPLASNFDPCAELSAVVVSIEGGTGSSPSHALMFNRGVFQGTATYEALPFTDLAVRTGESDTVTLTYRTGQSCNACSDGETTPVRYQWNGSAVEMLDLLPPELR